MISRLIVMNRLEPGDLAGARLAPGRPEIQEEVLAAEVFQFEKPAIRPSKLACRLSRLPLHIPRSTFYQELVEL